MKKTILRLFPKVVCWFVCVCATGRSNDVVVVCGATGCGKTTQLPQLCIDNFQTRVLCTQPRRISATSVAARVAFERGERVGDVVGYQVDKILKCSYDRFFC